MKIAKQDELLAHNNYINSHMTIGPPVNRSSDEWGNALRSRDDAEVLSALVWLNGYHQKREPSLPDSVRKRLQELTQSENVWLKITAQSLLENNK